MTERFKSHHATAEKIHAGVLCTSLEIMKLAKETIVTKLDPIVEVVLRLGVDPRRADQMACSTVPLPHGTGGTTRILVFTIDKHAQEAIDAGTNEVGGNELIEEVTKGYTDFDVVATTPDLMGKAGRFGRVLGPWGLMSNPKTGMVTMNIARVIKEIKGGRTEFRADKHANLAFTVGKVSFTAEQLAENYTAILERTLRLKPAVVKDRYTSKATVFTTMDPGTPIDPTKTKNVAK